MGFRGYERWEEFNGSQKAERIIRGLSSSANAFLSDFSRVETLKCASSAFDQSDCLPVINIRCAPP